MFIDNDAVISRCSYIVVYFVLFSLRSIEHHCCVLLYIYILYNSSTHNFTELEVLFHRITSTMFYGGVHTSTLTWCVTIIIIPVFRPHNRIHVIMYSCFSSEIRRPAPQVPLQPTALSLIRCYLFPCPAFTNSSDNKAVGITTEIILAYQSGRKEDVRVIPES